MFSLTPEFRLNAPRIMHTGENAGGSNMTSKWTENAIERIIAACEGDVYGALEALLLVNEHLEVELHQLYAAVCPSPCRTTVH